MLSKTQRAIRAVFECGYRVRKDGSVVAPGGNIRALSQSGQTTRYWTFSFKFEGCVRPIHVHRLVAYQKYGEKAIGRIHTRHKNGDSLDNRPGNIVLGTASQNMMDQPAEVRQARAQHAANHLRKYDDATVAKMRARRGEGYSLRMIVAEFGCTKSTASILTRI